MHPDSYVVWDTETTGLDPLSDRITEVGWVRVEHGVPQGVRSLLVWAGKCVPEEVSKITGITTRMIVSDGVPEKEALYAFLSDAGDLPIIGHNQLRFDVRFLMAACARTGLTPPSVDRYLDTAAIYKARCMGVSQDGGENHARFALRVLERRVRGLKYNLAHACQDLGIDVSDLTAHRAAADVEMTRRLYEALLREAVPA